MSTGSPTERRLAAALEIPDDRFVVAVMGGSLGSGPLNDAIRNYLIDHRDDVGLAVHQIAGERFAGHDVERDARATGV